MEYNDIEVQNPAHLSALVMYDIMIGVKRQGLQPELQFHQDYGHIITVSNAFQISMFNIDIVLVTNIQSDGLKAGIDDYNVRLFFKGHYTLDVKDRPYAVLIAHWNLLQDVARETSVNINMHLTKDRIAMLMSEAYNEYLSSYWNNIQG